MDADIEIVMSLCDVCSSSDASGVAEVVLTCFESRSKILPLLKAFIEKEVASTGKKEDR